LIKFSSESRDCNGGADFASISSLWPERDKCGTTGAKTPMEWPAQPEEIAPAWVFLAAPQCARYITRKILPIIGGYGDG